MSELNFISDVIVYLIWYKAEDLVFYHIHIEYAPWLTDFIIGKTKSV